jgi:hypothetical protein
MRLLDARVDEELKSKYQLSGRIPPSPVSLTKGGWWYLLRGNAGSRERIFPNYYIIKILFPHTRMNGGRRLRDRNRKWN